MWIISPVGADLIPPLLMGLLEPRSAARSKRKVVKKIDYKFQVSIDQVNPNGAACATAAQEVVESRIG